MLKKSEITITFKIHQSIALMKGVVILHLAAFLAVFLSALVLAYKVVLWNVVLFSLFFYVAKFREYKSQFIRYSLRSGWEFAQSDLKFYPIDILSSTVITQFLLFLHFKQQSAKKQTILIYKDALIKDDYRKLMVELRLSGLKRDDNEPK